MSVTCKLCNATKGGDNFTKIEDLIDKANIEKIEELFQLWKNKENHRALAVEADKGPVDKIEGVLVDLVDAFYASTGEPLVKLHLKSDQIDSKKYHISKSIIDFSNQMDFHDDLRGQEVCAKSY